jgi:glycine dehydrogenase subunit 1
LSCELDSMLERIGVKSAEELFADIPQNVRTGKIKLPDGMDERSARACVEALMAKNLSAAAAPCFMGAGHYDHYSPAALHSIVGRSEFITAYTPYQPEISQGMLQSLFEYQCLMTELTGMDVVNDSMYDGATALAEAALMSSRMTGKDEFAIPASLYKDYKSVLRNYLDGPGMRLVEYDFNPMTGQADPSSMSSAVNENTAGLFVQSPNSFGALEEILPEARDIAGKAALVVGVNPMSLALLKPPVDFGADIVVGDVQPLGLGMNFGGPGAGLFAVKKEHARKMPGRLVGMTADSHGKRAFCLTLSTREQHIRRSKATSNICSNQALMAVASAAYVALMGRKGLQRVAEQSLENAHALAAELAHVKDLRAPLFKSPFFNEFAIGLPLDAREVNKRLARKNVIGGVPLALHPAGLGDSMLLACTERSDAEARKALVDALRGVLA